MVRYFRIAATVLAVSTGCALIAMRSRSYSTADMAHTRCGGKDILLASQRGQVILLAIYNRPPGCVISPVGVVKQFLGTSRKFWRKAI